MAKNGYDFYLDKCLLPVPPSKLETTINNENKTVTLINEGEINILKKAGLTDIEFECDIPQVKQPYAVYPSGFKGASYFLDYFEDLKTSQKPFQFIVCRRSPNGKAFFNTNMKVSLEDYKITEDAKEGFDLKVKINLKQYRDYGTKTVDIKIASSKAKETSDKKSSTKKKTTASTKKKRAESTTKKKKTIGIGSTVIVNGRLHRDSYGNGPGQTRTNYKGKINFINMKGSHPYHVTTPSGGWLGWVTKGSVKGV